MVRAYYPSDWALRPFIEAFGTEQSTHSAVHAEFRTHGASLGTRYYLSPDLAVDPRVMHRIYDPGSSPFPYSGPHLETVFDVGLTVHQPH
ncbi:MAG: hypothetical protein ACRENQ_10600 [Gemmatimonadaceae bacterium]